MKQSKPYNKKRIRGRTTRWRVALKKPKQVKGQILRNKGFKLEGRQSKAGNKIKKRKKKSILCKENRTTRGITMCKGEFILCSNGFQSNDNE